VNYLDDLLNEMTKEIEEDEEPPHHQVVASPTPAPAPNPQSQPKSPGVREHARPGMAQNIIIIQRINTING
jgi:hypothetical protein